MTALDDLATQLRQAISATEQALTAVARAGAHATQAADLYQSTTTGTHHRTVTTAAHHTRTTAQATLPLQATLSTALTTLRTYLTRITGGTPGSDLAATPVPGEELAQPSRRRRSIAGRLYERVVSQPDELSEKAGQAGHLFDIARTLREGGLKPPVQAQSGTVAEVSPESAVPAPAEPILAADVVSNVVVVAVVVARSVDHIVDRIIDRRLERIRERKREHGRPTPDR